MVKFIEERKFGSVYVWLTKDVDSWGVGNSVSGTVYGYSEEQARTLYAAIVEIHVAKELAEAV